MGPFTTSLPPLRSAPLRSRAYHVRVRCAAYRLIASQKKRAESACLRVPPSLPPDQALLSPRSLARRCLMRRCHGRPVLGRLCIHLPCLPSHPRPPAVLAESRTRHHIADDRRARRQPHYKHALSLARCLRRRHLCRDAAKVMSSSLRGWVSSTFLPFPSP